MLGSSDPKHLSKIRERVSSKLITLKKRKGKENEEVFFNDGDVVHHER